MDFCATEAPGLLEMYDINTTPERQGLLFMHQNQGKVPEMVEKASAFMCGLYQSLEFRIDHLDLRWKEYCLISINIKMAVNVYAEALSSKAISSMELIFCAEKKNSIKGL